jgi:hypothetical protein
LLALSLNQKQKPVIMATEQEIQKAKDLLQDNGYFVANLWRTEDVTENYECEEGDAQEVLEGALTNDAVTESIWYAIDVHAEEIGLKRK